MAGTAVARSRAAAAAAAEAEAEAEAEAAVGLLPRSSLRGHMRGSSLLSFFK